MRYTRMTHEARESINKPLMKSVIYWSADINEATYK